MSSLVRSLGYEACVFASAEAFLASPRLQDTACLIADIQMPGMSGLDLLLKIEQIDPQLPVVLATGYAELPVRGGPLRFPRLGKPYTQAQLAQVLDTAANARMSTDRT
jgi:FixJ family two-component response regulator